MRFNIRSNFQTTILMRLINCHFHFFFRQFDNFESMIKLTFFLNENIKRYQINFIFFVNSITLNQCSNQHLIFFVFFFVFFLVFFFVFFFFVNDNFEFMIKSTFFFQLKVLNVIKSTSLHDEKSRRQTIKHDKVI